MNPTPELSLNDIILPDAIGLWPLAPGWWALMLLIVLLPLVIFWLIRWRRRVKQQRQPLRQALAALDQLSGHTLSPQFCARLNEQLKCYCRQRQPRAVALYGQAWADFIRSQADVFTAEQYQLLASAAYQAEIREQADMAGAQALLQAAQTWLKATDNKAGGNHA